MSLCSRGTDVRVGPAQLWGVCVDKQRVVALGRDHDAQLVAGGDPEAGLVSVVLAHGGQMVEVQVGKVTWGSVRWLHSTLQCSRLLRRRHQKREVWSAKHEGQSDN